MITENSRWTPWTGLSKRNALIVGDDPMLKRCMSARLRRMNFNVESAGNYVAATEHLASQAFHFACVNVQLPCRSGYDLCDHIRRSPKLIGIPILMMGAYASPVERAHAEEAGAHAFLQMPFSMGRFDQCVESLLGMSRPLAMATREVGPPAWMTIFDCARHVTA